MFTYNSNISAYQLTIALDKYTVAVEWLLKSSCDFNAHFKSSSSEVKFTFEVIPTNVINKLNEKYNPALSNVTYASFDVNAAYEALMSKNDKDPAAAPVSMFEHKLNNGDLVGAINQSILLSEETSRMAQAALADLDATRDRLTQLANDTVDKYPML